MKPNRRIKRKSHNLEYFIMNLFVFAGIGLLSFIVFNVSLFNQFTQAFKDFTITDMYYSQMLNKNNMYKGPLEIINIENRSRGEIAFLLQKLEEGHPKVIGLDAIFQDTANATEDSLLKTTFSNYSNIVLPYIASFNKNVTPAQTNEYFGVQSNSFVNIAGVQKEYTTLRYYYPAYDHIPAFTTAMLQMYDPVVASSLIKRNKQKTEIRYYGDLQNFDYRTFDEVMSDTFNTQNLKDKILLLGYAGEQNAPGNKLDEDRFFTPLNPQLSGRSYPDMYGTVVHANILRMGLDKDFIYTLPTWLNWLLAFMLNWLLLPMFVRWYVHKAVWFHLFTMLLQLAISMLFVYFTILMYAYQNIKIESSAVLVAVLLLGDFLLFYDHLVKFLKYKLKWDFNSKFLEGGH